MSRTITIVGAGQSGLHLAHGLLGAGFDVTLVADREPDRIRAGRVTSGQVMYHTTLRHERELGLDFWQDAPVIEGVTFSIPADVPAQDGGKALGFGARFSEPAQSIDQRVKLPRLIEEFERRGGTVVMEAAGIHELERYAATSELVIVATGKGEISKLFTRDPGRSFFAEPQRALAVTYVHGFEPREDFTAVSFNLVPGVGEFFTLPAETISGPCDIWVFEGIPAGPLDCWQGLTAKEHLDRSIEILETYGPWEAARAKNVELTDELGVLQGRFPPTIRHPIAELPSGRLILGVGDAVVLNDPITGQGSNNAARCAAIYLERLIAHGDGAYTREFLGGLFAEFWEYVQHVARWTNTLLLPPTDQTLAVLDAAARHPAVASRFVQAFTDPVDFQGWFFDPRELRHYLDKVRAEEARKGRAS